MLDVLNIPSKNYANPIIYNFVFVSKNAINTNLATEINK